MLTIYIPYMFSVIRFEKKFIASKHIPKETLVYIWYEDDNSSEMFWFSMHDPVYMYDMLA